MGFFACQLLLQIAICSQTKEEMMMMMMMLLLLMMMMMMMKKVMNKLVICNYYRVQQGFRAC